MSALSTPQPARHAQPTARATALTHLIFERADLDGAARFLQDFGLRNVSQTPDLLILRAAGPQSYCYRIHRARKSRFVGLGLAVEDAAGFEALSRLPDAGAVTDAPYPGGGRSLVLKDPSGFTVEVLRGQQCASALAQRTPLPINAGAQTPRINIMQRAPVEPPEVLRLGHVVLECADFQDTCGWYTQHFGFIPSDVQILPDGSPAVTFMRLDLGDVPADHHTLALVQGFMPAYSHSAYEVIDADAVGMGQRVLRTAGYRHAWGMGRHILGSQIFDYWNDPAGAKHEHYCDGDLLTADVPMGVHPVSREAMSQWGQVMPASFVKPKLTPANVLALIRNVRRSPDLSVEKLKTIAKIFG